MAINELEGDEKALVVFMDSVISVMNQFAKNNNQTLDEFFDKMKGYAKKVKPQEMEFH